MCFRYFTFIFGVFDIINMDKAAHSDSAAESESSASIQPGQDRHKCMNCSRVMANREIDPHLICSVCRGINCDLDNRCDECHTWSPDFMKKNVKYLRSLERRRESKRKRKLSKSNDSTDFDVICTVGESQGQDSGASQDSSDGIMTKVVDLFNSKAIEQDRAIDEKLRSFSKTFSEEMLGHFGVLAKELTAVIKDSIPAPSQSAVDCASDGQGTTDLSRPDPQHGATGLGVNVEGRRLGSLTSKSPVTPLGPLGRGRGRVPSSTPVSGELRHLPSLGHGRGSVVPSQSGNNVGPRAPPLAPDIIVVPLDSIPDHTHTPDHDSPIKTPLPIKTPIPNKTPIPDKSPAQFKTPVSVRTPIPDESPIPDDDHNPDEVPVPDNQPGNDDIPDNDVSSEEDNETDDDVFVPPKTPGDGPIPSRVDHSLDDIDQLPDLPADPKSIVFSKVCSLIKEYCPNSDPQISRPPKIFCETEGIFVERETKESPSNQLNFFGKFLAIRGGERIRHFP